MFEVEDKTDRFTGKRDISALLQQQDGMSPEIRFSASIMGHDAMGLSGTGSYHLLMEWQDSDAISGLAGLLGMAPESGVEEFNLFHCLIDGKLTQFESVVISKHPSAKGDILLLIISATPELLDRISSANSVECRAYECEFIMDENVKGKIGNLLSLSGRAKTSTQASEEIQAQIDNKILSAELVGKVVGAAILVGFIVFMYQMLT